MRRYLPICLCVLLISSTLAAKTGKIESVPLLALRMARKGAENTIWMEQRAKIGKDSVIGYIQGTGGADDALIGFELDDEWDLLEVTIGFLATTPEGRTAEFSVESDGEVLYDSGTISSKTGATVARIPLKKSKRFLLRITSDNYNGTAGATWGAPTLYRGLGPEDLETSWSLKVNGRTSPLSGSGAPKEVMIPLPVSGDEEATYTVKVRRDEATRTVIVERE